MNIWAVVLAAGKGTRLAQAADGQRKQYLQYRGAPLFWASARTFAAMPVVKGVVFVFSPEDIENSRKMLAGLVGRDNLGLPWLVAEGGERRQDSVRNGLDVLPRECTHVLVHDSARPFATPRMISRLVDALVNGEQAVIPGIPVTDTIKILNHDVVCHTPLRHDLCAVQTPQAFELDFLRQVHEKARQHGWDVTDDAMLVEQCEGRVYVVEGEAGNIKITNPEDLRLLRRENGEQAMQKLPVSGFGYDVHRYMDPQDPKARPMILGGFPIPGAPGVAAHSDGDVLLHALADAVLGCVGLGDIGGLFPDTDPQYDNASSGMLLAEVMERARAEGFEPTHADLTIIAQAPRLSQHRECIRKSVAHHLGLTPRQVNVKATTEEKLGFTGRKEGIKAVALVNGLLAG
ncbi:MAG: 2-C-methyl-D-erythritol 4-phosphate cytidylyltransferase [Desulfovibrio sp.]|uniref:2-C-methyl-D-erythritol 4-phosphate cytidylyltransferase n=1 Tax=Desulfovibrio sp. 7SRBS1 TaxID=3378064 RepID=UPI003B3F09BB